MAGVGWPLAYYVACHWAPRREMGMAMAFMTMGVELGILLNCPIAHYQCQQWGWHSIFHSLGRSLAFFSLLWCTAFRNDTSECQWISGSEKMLILKERSTRCENSFENVYSSSSLHTPWYVIAGNHDHYGNVTAQVAYSKKSPRWTFPSLWYPVNYQLNDGTTVEYVMIDTVTLCGNTRDMRFGDLMAYVGLESHDPPGPEDIQKSEQQWTWIEQKLKASTAKYLFVVGHFPVYSVSEHGPTKCLVDRLLPLLYENKVSAYLSGHDHNLQHLSTTKNDRTVHFVLSGAAGFMDTSKDHINSVPEDSLKFLYPDDGWSPFGLAGFTNGGYIYSEVTESQAIFKYFKGNTHDDPVHQFTIKPRI